MVIKTNLAEDILQSASVLFREQGYAATTIKQIARAVGCTTAALYYYYEGGKAEILRAVIRSYQDRTNFEAGIQGNDSLAELIKNLATTLSLSLPERADQISWLLLEYASLSEGEQQAIQEPILGIQAALRSEITRFVHDETEADQLAWIIFSAFFGYQQLFMKAEIGQHVDMDLHAYGDLLARLISTSAGLLR